jgi:hypothetical protein
MDNAEMAVPRKGELEAIEGRITGIISIENNISVITTYNG